jgi:hypothetical protein
MGTSGGGESSEKGAIGERSVQEATVRIRPLFVVAFVLLAASCAKQAAPSSNATPANGLLVITQEMARDGGVYTEGYVPFVTVAQNGQKVFSTRLALDQPLSHQLRVGSYALTYVVHPCDASCDRLDGPAETCSASFTVASDQTVKAHAVERPAEGCSIAVQS